MKSVFKIMTLAEWGETSQTGVYLGSALDRRDGYIHLSTSVQVEETIIRHFANSGVLMLVALSVPCLGAHLRFEPSRGGDLFPHLYADLKLENILWSREFDSNYPADLKNLAVE